MTEVFVLRYNVPTVITWIMCARRLPRFHKDIARLIATKYLLEKRFHCSPCSFIYYHPSQLETYKMLNDCTKFTIVDTEKIENYRPVAAGIAAIATIEKFRVCVYDQSGGQFGSLITEMLQGKSGEFAVTNDLRGHSSGLLIIMDADKMTPLQFFHRIVPYLQMTPTKLVLYGNCFISLFLNDLKRSSFNTI
jgi:hypothetical protein